MSKLVVVKGDPVRGTDKHNVTGIADTPSTPPPAYAGIGSFEYKGAMTDELSDFVTIDGVPVALVTSSSSLDPGETDTGKHVGMNGSGFVPASPGPLLDKTLSIIDVIGTGIPNAGAGSGVLTVNGVKALLDTDKIDTCSGVGALAGSSTTAQGQSFVSCSE